MYNGSGHLICPRCKADDKRDFDRVRDYVYENKGSTIIEVSEALDIKPSIIEGFLRAGRLEIPEGSAIFIHCEQCNKEIRSGRFCPDCAEHMTAKMKEMLDFDDSQIGEVPNLKGKMRFLGRDRK
jgi:hypothetical protein